MIQNKNNIYFPECVLYLDEYFKNQVSYENFKFRTFEDLPVFYTFYK